MQRNYEMIDRDLVVMADGEIIPNLFHVRLTGRFRPSLYPHPYFLRIWNGPKNLYNRMLRTKVIQVLHDNTIMAEGDVVDVTEEIAAEGRLVTVTLALGYHLWNSWVSLTVGAGVTAGDTVRQLLCAAGSEYILLNDPPFNPVFARPQSFFGRLPDAIAKVLSACEVQPQVIASGIILLPVEDCNFEVVMDLDSVSGPWIHKYVRAIE